MQIPEEAMRLVDVVIVSVLLGMGLGLLQAGRTGVRAGATLAEAADCGRSKCERVTWLRTPLTPRATYSE
jgi:hypothetical protein